MATVYKLLPTFALLTVVVAGADVGLPRLNPIDRMGEQPLSMSLSHQRHDLIATALKALMEPDQMVSVCFALPLWPTRTGWSVWWWWKFMVQESPPCNRICLACQQMFQADGRGQCVVVLVRMTTLCWMCGQYGEEITPTRPSHAQLCSLSSGRAQCWCSLLHTSSDAHLR